MHGRRANVYQRLHPASHHSKTIEKIEYVVDDDDLRRCCIVSTIFIALLLVALIVVILVLTLTEKPAQVIPVVQISWIETDLLAWNTSVPCCSIWTSKAIALGLSLGLTSFCNGVLQSCTGTNANQLAQPVNNFLSTTGVASGTFSVTDCLWGNVTAVELIDPTNTVSIPFDWWNLRILTNNAYIITNEAQLTYPDPYTNLPTLQLGLVACDGVVQRAQNAAVNFNVLTINPQNPTNVIQ